MKKCFFSFLGDRVRRLQKYKSFQEVIPTIRSHFEISLVIRKNIHGKKDIDR